MNASRDTDITSTATAAAVDLGSNSFHMVVARVDEAQLHVVDRMRERVRLADGLNEKRNLSSDAIARAVACLERFGQRVRELPPGAVRAAGTNTLRLARNSADFLQRAQEALGHPIEVISGREEARLIYLGVAHSVPDAAGRRLVVDIGGGSTECIIGERFDAISTESLYMGSLGFTKQFFPDGALTKERFKRAEIAALVELQSLRRHYQSLGWQACYGSSGTVLAVARLLRENGWSSGGITRKGMKLLRKALCDAGHLEKVVLPGVEPERTPVLPGGLAILTAVFKSLRVESMSPSTGALREGLLYDLLGRIRHEDVRDRTIRWLAEHHGVDLEQAGRIERAALLALDQVEESWCLRHEEARLYLSWASRLHEIGLEISHTGYHKHSAYIVENSDMPGFSRTEQQLLGVVIRGHRRKLLREHFAKLPPWRVETALRLSVLFRLACCLNRSRSNRPLPAVTLSAKKGALSLSFPKDWLEENPLTLADLQEDVTRLGEVGLLLRIA